jgi:Fe-Mn family superoxide dismutase
MKKLIYLAIQDNQKEKILMAFELAPLPYAKDALLPYMSVQHLEIHHGKHHATYVTNLNNLTKDKPEASLSLEEIILLSAGKADQVGLFNNAAQVWNHDFFWNSLKPNGGGAMPSELEKKIVEDFGSVDGFREAFVQAGLTQFGSGWSWLVQGADGKLKVTKTAGADLPLTKGEKALITCDVWEHAYYLDYQNRRADFLKAFLDNMVNWEFAASQLVK